MHHDKETQLHTNNKQQYGDNNREHLQYMHMEVMKQAIIVIYEGLFKALTQWRKSEGLSTSAMILLKVNMIYYLNIFQCYETEAGVYVHGP